MSSEIPKTTPSFMQKVRQKKEDAKSAEAEREISQKASGDGRDVSPTNPSSLKSTSTSVTQEAQRASNTLDVSLNIKASIKDTDKKKEDAQKKETDAVINQANNEIAAWANLGGRGE